ncbi:MAG: ribonuclease D, partial [Anaerolineae bacterium]
SDDLNAPWMLVTAPEQLEQVVQELRRHPLVAVDTESNSLYAYYEQVCLIQLSTPAMDYIIDPLALPDIRPLGELFADSAQQKVFHAAEYDIGTLRRDFGFEFRNVFDTMLAGQLLGVKHLSLAHLLEERLGVHIDKRYQQYNWGHRPLSEAVLAYARLDTHYLLPLRENLLAELRARRLEHVAEEAFRQVEQAVWNRAPADPDAYLRLEGAQELDPEGLGVLRELYQLRDEIARRRNRAPFRVLSDHLLVELSRRRPHSTVDLDEVLALPAWPRRQYGHAILQAIARGEQKPVILPANGRRGTNNGFNHLTEDMFERLRAWRNQRAEEEGIPLSVLMSNRLLRRIAEERPASLEELRAIAGMSDFILSRYGAELVRLIGRSRQKK